MLKSHHLQKVWKTREGSNHATAPALVNVITPWRSFLTLLWRLSQLVFSKSKFFNQPGLALCITKERKRHAGITPNKYHILPLWSNHMYTLLQRLSYNTDNPSKKKERFLDDDCIHTRTEKLPFTRDSHC